MSIAVRLKAANCFLQLICIFLRPFSVQKQWQLSCEEAEVFIDGLIQCVSPYAGLAAIRLM